MEFGSNLFTSNCDISVRDREGEEKDSFLMKIQNNINFDLLTSWNQPRRRSLETKKTKIKSLKFSQRSNKRFEL